MKPKTKRITNTEKQDLANKLIWQFNTDRELMKLIEHHSEYLLKLSHETPSVDGQNLIITHATRIAFLAKNLRFK